MIELESLDLAPALGVEERNAAPILAVCEMERERAAARFSAVKHKVSAYAGLSLAELCREHLAAPNESTRATILSTPLTTRAEALATFSVIEADSEDQELAARLLKGLRSYLSAD